MPRTAAAALTAGTPAVAAAGRLSEEDLRILALENATVAGHTCKVITVRGDLDPALLRASLASRLHLAPRLGLRLGSIDGIPWWVPAREVDLEFHVTDQRAASPPDEAGYLAAVADLFRQHLDRSRPLWRIDILGPLPGGGSALVWRIHHALADGMTGMRLARAVLWDDAPGQQDGPGDAQRPRPARPARQARRPAWQHPLAGLLAAAREVPQPWLHSPFDGHIDSRRAVAFTSAGIADLRAAAAAVDGATINDAVLTVVAGGLRRWLEAHHGHLGAIRVKVPVSLHGPAAADGTGDPGNRDSFFFVDLPLGPADPAERLAEIRAATRTRKQGHDAQYLDALMRDLAGIPRLRQFAARALANPRSFALNVSDVPGPPQPVEVLGMPVTGLHSLAEIGQHHALRVCAVSLAGRLNFGLVADPTLLPDVAMLAACIEAETSALTGVPSTP